MKTLYAVTVAAGLSLGVWGISGAADMATDSMAEKPGVVEAQAASMTGTVTAIDYTTRMVTLKGANGQEVTMEVGPEAVRFNEVKKGDIVKIDYLESVAVMVQNPHDSVGSAEATGTVIIRNKTKKPSGMAVHTQVVTATVEKIDAKKRTATLKMPDGHMVPLDIAPDVKNVENVKKGDQVVVKYTMSVGITVSKP